jgi:hypothetical protein
VSPKPWDRSNGGGVSPEMLRAAAAASLSASGVSVSLGNGVDTPDWLAIAADLAAALTSGVPKERTRALKRYAAAVREATQ